MKFEAETCPETRGSFSFPVTVPLNLATPPFNVTGSDCGAAAPASEAARRISLRSVDSTVARMDFSSVPSNRILVAAVAR